MIVALSGCTATTQVLDSSSITKEMLHFSDAIVAIGMPKTTIPNYPNALILAGETHYYLIRERNDMMSSKTMNAIFSHLELAHLRIQMMSNPILRSAKKMGEYGYGAYITLIYDKPEHKITHQEQNVLNKHRCTKNTNSGEVYVSCKLHLHLDLIPFNKPKNQILAHRFLKPQVLNFYGYKKSSYNTSLVLVPLSVVVDMITLPIQFIGVIGNTIQYND